MGMFWHLFYPWGIIPVVLALVHFARRRPDNYWLYVILFIGPPGALIYLIVEAIPDAAFLRQSFKAFPRWRRIGELENAIKSNPSSGNYEELGDLYLEDGKLAKARQAYEQAIQARATTIDPFYHRGVCALLLGDPTAALPDLERTVRESPGHDFQRASGLLADAYARTAQPEKAEGQFQLATAKSTLSETYLNYADFLASQGRTPEARHWAQKVLDKKPALLGYQRRRERPAFRRANKLLKTLAGS